MTNLFSLFYPILIVCSDEFFDIQDFYSDVGFAESCLWHVLDRWKANHGRGTVWTAERRIMVVKSWRYERWRPDLDRCDVSMVLHPNGSCHDVVALALWQLGFLVPICYRGLQLVHGQDIWERLGQNCNGYLRLVMFG